MSDIPDPAAVTPTVARDVAADAAGEARDLTPSPPPPGTVVARFWQSAGTFAAIAATLSLGLYVARPYVVSLIGEGGAAMFETAVWAWGAAFGVHKAEPALRYK